MNLTEKSAISTPKILLAAAVLLVGGYLVFVMLSRERGPKEEFEVPEGQAVEIEEFAGSSEWAGVIEKIEGNKLYVKFAGYFGEWPELTVVYDATGLEIIINANIPGEKQKGTLSELKTGDSIVLFFGAPIKREAFNSAKPIRIHHLKHIEYDTSKAQ